MYKTIYLMSNTRIYYLSKYISPKLVAPGVGLGEGERDFDGEVMKGSSMLGRNACKNVLFSYNCGPVRSLFTRFIVTAL